MTDNEPIEGVAEEIHEPVPAVASKSVVIFDIDRTLADTRHRDHLQPPPGTTAAVAYREFTAQCWNDGPIWDTVAMLFMMAAMNNKIVLKTGRTEEFRMMTSNWLGYLGVPFDALIMLNDDFDGDYGAWKGSMLDHPEIGGADKVLCVFDDHPESVAAYTKAGVTCYQAPPYTGERMDSPLKDSGLYDAVDMDEVGHE